MDNIVRGVLYYPCSMVLGQFFCRFTGSAAQTHCARRPQLVSKKFLEKEIFASWRLIAKIAKISASRKFRAIRYVMVCNNILANFYYKIAPSACNGRSSRRIFSPFYTAKNT